MPGRAGPGVIPPQLATPTPVVGVRGARPPRINTPGNSAVDPRVNKQRQPRMGLRGPSPRNSKTPTPYPAGLLPHPPPPTPHPPSRGSRGPSPCNPQPQPRSWGSGRHPNPDSNPDRGGSCRHPNPDSNPDRGGPGGSAPRINTPGNGAVDPRGQQAALAAAWAWMDLNHRPHPYQVCALTELSYRPRTCGRPSKAAATNLVRRERLPHPGGAQDQSVSFNVISTPPARSAVMLYSTEPTVDSAVMSTTLIAPSRPV